MRQIWISKSMTYKYCKNESWPSCEASWPDKFALPRSLCKKKQANVFNNQIKLQQDHIQHLNLRVIKPGLHSCNIIIIIARYMKPSAGIDEGSIPALKNIGRIEQVVLQCIQGIPWHTMFFYLTQFNSQNVANKKQCTSVTQLTTSTDIFMLLVKLN